MINHPSNPFSDLGCVFSKKIIVTYHTVGDNFCEINLELIFILTTSIFSSIITSILVNFGSSPPLFINGALCLIASLVIPKYQEIFVSASLAGLSNNETIINVGYAFILGIITSFIFICFKTFLIGIGGRLGLIAYISSITNCFIIFLTHRNYEFPCFKLENYKILDTYIYIFGPLIGGLSSTLVHFHYELTLRNKNKLTAACNVICISCLLLNLFNKDLLYKFFNVPNTYGAIFQFFVHHSPLASTVSYNHIDLQPKKADKLFFYHFFFIGYICGWIYISILGLECIGGKDGLIAFLGCYTYVNIIKALKYFIKDEDEK